MNQHSIWISEIVDFYEEFGLRTPTHLFALLRIDEPELRDLSKGASFITDEYNLLAMQAPFLLANRDPEGMKAFLRSSLRL